MHHYAAKIHPVSSLIDSFLNTKQSNRPTTQQSYYRVLSIFYRTTETDLITESSLNIFLEHLRNRQISQGSYNHYLTILKVYANFLKRRDHITDVGFLKDYPLYAHPEKVLFKKYYPEDMVRNFLDSAKPRWFHYFLFLGFYFAFRPNEIARLETADIYLDQMYIDVRPSVQKIPKQDYIAIPNLFQNKFHELLTWRDRQESTTDYLIVNTTGKYIKRDILNHHLSSLKKIDSEFRLYNMRYTAAWRAYKQTQNIYAAQQLLRHTNPSETVNYLGIQREEVLFTQRQDMQLIFSEVLI